MTETSEAVGTLEVALAHARRLLASNPAAAVEQATEILKVVPDHPGATTLLGIALGANRQGEAAVAALRRAVQLRADQPDAWRALGDHLTALGDAQGADAAYAQNIRYSTRDPRLMSAAVALCDNRIAVAEAELREHLKAQPTDVAAIRMLAEVASRLGRYADAEVLLERALELAPSFAPARVNYAYVLHRSNKSERALVEVDRVLAHDPANPGYRNLKAAILARIGDIEQSIDLYKAVTREYPNNPKVWMSFGHALKTGGHQDEAIGAYRRSLQLAPQLGETWWSLANLKTFSFSAADLESMQAQLQRTDLTREDRFHFHFAIGKALEDARQYEASFEHYEKGNAQRRELIPYDRQETTGHVRRSKALFTPEFFAQRAGERL